MTIRQNGHIVISFYDASGHKHRHIMSISPSGNATKRYDAQLRHMLGRGGRYERRARQERRPVGHKYLRETGFPNLDAAMKFWEACHAKGMSHDEVAALEQQMRERGRAQLKQHLLVVLCRPRDDARGYKIIGRNTAGHVLISGTFPYHPHEIRVMIRAIWRALNQWAELPSLGLAETVKLGVVDIDGYAELMCGRRSEVHVVRRLRVRGRTCE